MRETPTFLPRAARRLGGAALAAFLMASAAMPQGGAPDVFAPLPDPHEVNAARAALGEMLFFDSRLSGDMANSCATCHSPETGWSDGRPMSTGYTGVEYFRNAPSLFNVANRTYFMWDGRLDGADLGTVVRDMITESHTMLMDSRLMQHRLAQVPEYARMFQDAYGNEPYGGRIYGAIGEYLKTIRTEGAPFDAYLRGDEAAMSEAALRGMELFAGEAGCAACHAGAMLSDGGLYATGAPDHPELLGTGGDAEMTALRQITLLRHYATMGTPNYMNLREDVGNYVVTKDEADWGRFVTPSLWDVGQTAPYMHSGVYGTLEEVVAFYNEGGGADDRGGLEPLDLDDQQMADLVAFLDSLTGSAPNVTVPDLPDYALRTLGQN
ncbi:MAG: c-type cytochrome [Roseicyclus sp.]|nr:c-type cytochrome [Roseicyclus sp.]MBO6623759.1 c-type cytochrome [Roseicyclus sp.]MBO6922283.1 c-type cytochrome [Roseicyclus sp.]